MTGGKNSSRTYKILAQTEKVLHVFTNIFLHVLFIDAQRKSQTMPHNKVRSHTNHSGEQESQFLPRKSQQQSLLQHRSQHYGDVLSSFKRFPSPCLPKKFLLFHENCVSHTNFFFFSPDSRLYHLNVSFFCFVNRQIEFIQSELMEQLSNGMQLISSLNYFTAFFIHQH